MRVDKRLLLTTLHTPCHAIFGILVLLLCWSSLNSMAADAFPSQFNILKPPARTAATIWMDVTQAESNIGLSVLDGTYSGHVRFLQTPTVPGPEGYYLRYTVDVPANRAGNFRIMHACGPAGVDYVSPTELVVDGKLIRKVTTVQTGQESWGIASVVRWVDFGSISLTPGKHTIAFVVRETRRMDNNYIQEYDAMALIHDEDMRFPATFKSATTLKQTVANAGETITVPLQLSVVSGKLAQPLMAYARLQLIHRGGVVTELPIALEVGPESVGHTISKDISYVIPYDVADGTYQFRIMDLQNIAGDKQGILLGNLTIKGRYQAQAERTPRLQVPTLVTAANANAGKKWTFSLKVKPVTAIATPPSRLLIRLELAPHLAYLTEAFPVKSTKAWPAGKAVTVGPYNLSLPADLPAGQYTVQAAFVGEAYAERDAANVAVGKLTVTGTATRATTSLKPLTYGTFVDSTRTPHLWNSNGAYTLIWDGEPFMPVSGMFNGPYMSFDQGEDRWNKLCANVDAVRSHGLNHLYLFTQGPMSTMRGAQWEHLMDYLDSVGVTYVIGNCSGSPVEMDLALDARPVRATAQNALKVENITLPGDVTRKITQGELNYAPNTVTSCLAFARRADGFTSPLVEAIVASTNNKEAEVTADFTTLPAGSYTVYFLPRIHTTCISGNPWDGWHAQVESTLAYLKTVKFRPGFRGFIDMILPNERGIYNDAESLFIESPAFLADRATELQKRYGTTAQLAKAWGLQGPVPATFTVAARLFPAYNDTEQNSLILADPVEKRTYLADTKKTVFWYEYLLLRDDSYGRFQNRMLDAIREHVDVPVYIKRCGMTERYHSNPNAADFGLNGAGYEIYAHGEGIVPYGAGLGYVEMLQAKKQMIGAATEFSVGWAEDMSPNWPDMPSFFFSLAVSQYFCARSTYLFLFDVEPQSLYSRNRIIEDSRMLEWMGVWDSILKSHQDAVAKHTPYIYTSWPVADAWWVTPSERNAVNPTDDAPGLYATKAENGVWVLPVFDAATPAPVTIVTLADDPATSFYKREFESLLAKKDREVVFLGLRKNLGALSIDRYFTPDTFTIGNDVCQVLHPTPTSKVLAKDEQGRVWALQDGRLQIVARRQQKGGSLESMVKYITFPNVPQDGRASAQLFMEKVLGLKSVSFAAGKMRGVSFVKDGQPVIVFHTTSLQGNEQFDVTIPAGRTVTAIIPALGDKPVTANGGSRMSLRFPPGPGTNPRQGAGIGAITLFGLTPEEFGAILPADLAESIASVAPAASAVPDGFLLPGIVPPEVKPGSTTEVVKAGAALTMAQEGFTQANYQETDRLTQEWVVNAARYQLPAFYTLIGNVQLEFGKVAEGRAAYEKGLSVDSNDAGLHCGLGVALLAAGDTAGARREFRTAITAGGPAAEIAKRNLAKLGE